MKSGFAQFRSTTTFALYNSQLQSLPHVTSPNTNKNISVNGQCETKEACSSLPEWYGLQLPPNKDRLLGNVRCDANPVCLFGLLLRTHSLCHYHEVFQCDAVGLAAS